MRVPWAARRWNQSILKEIHPKHSLEELMLKLKFQCSAYLMQGSDLSKKNLMLGKIEDSRRRGDRDEMVGWYHWLNGYEFEETLEDEKQRSLACCSPWGCKDRTEGLDNKKNSNNTLENHFCVRLVIGSSNLVIFRNKIIENVDNGKIILSSFTYFEWVDEPDSEKLLILIF